MFKSWEEMTRQEQLASEHYDFYKAVHGIRPRWIKYDTLSEAELEVMLRELGEEMTIVEAREAEQHQAAIKAFELKVESLKSCGALTREQAVSWLLESVDATTDYDYGCFLFGLPYGYFSKEAA